MPFLELILKKNLLLIILFFASLNPHGMRHISLHMCMSPGIYGYRVYINNENGRRPAW